MANELKPLSNELYEHYPLMSAQTHEAHVKAYAKAHMKEGNTRPAAPVEGLERYRPANYMEMCLGGMFLDKDGTYVRFDQAEAIIAEERNRTELSEYKLDQAVNTVQPMIIRRAERAEADNAALTARFNTAEEKVKTLSSLCEEGFNREKYLETQIAAKDARIKDLVVALDQQLGTPCEQIAHSQQVEALETQLAAARKALQKIAGDTYDDSAEKIARAALEASHGE